MKLGTRIAIGVGVAVVIFGGQYLKNRKAKQEPATATTRAAPAKPVQVKAVPQRYTLGKLTFKPCELTKPGTGQRAAAWCSPFKVPENRADPSGRKINLKLALVRSDAAVPDKDIVVFLVGGPGQAATREYVTAARGFELLKKHHDILLLDQRGTGDSNPLSCPKASKKDKKLFAQSADTAAIKQAVADCLAEVDEHADPRFYTTTDAVADLEAVRQGLGAPKFDLIGVSYGTRMAQQYAMRHPDGVRSIVLDSAVPNTAILGEHIAVHLEQALKKDFALCTSDPACKKKFGDPYATLVKLRNDVQANPRKVSVRDPYTYEETEHTLNEDSLVSVVRMFAYSPLTIRLLPLSIHAAANGDFGPLMGQASLMQGDLGSDMNTGMGMSVTCSEDAALIKPRPQDKDTLMGTRFMTNLKAQCAVWPHGKMPADFHQPLTGNIPTIVLSGELDPVTPPRWGKSIVAHLGNARQIVLKGQGHSEFMTGCMPRVIRNFIVMPDPNKLDTSCLKRLGPPAMYVNFNGATP
jgi:pimeloyl-ACP methyl ester carboxylesterase